MILVYILITILTLFLFYVLFLSFCSLAVNPNKEYDQHSSFYRCLLDSATAVVMKLLRIRVHVTGMEQIPKDTKVLFVSNHRSNFDPIVTWYALKEWKIAFISKPENFKIPIFGRIIRRCCFMPIDRKNPRKAISTINRAAKLLKKQEVSIGVYPEGTRSKTAEVLPFHNGVFKIAQKADAPIVVLCIIGTEEISKHTPFKTTNVYLDVLDVFPVENVKIKKTELIGASAHRLIKTSAEMRDIACQKDI